MSLINRIIHKVVPKEKVAITEMIGSSDLLKHKNALIIGGTSGIGHAIAESFVKNGANVIVVGSNQDKCAKVKMELGLLNYYVLDLRNLAGIEDHIKDIDNLYENACIDILVNSAGITDSGDFLSASQKQFQDIMKINVEGTFFISQAVSKLMISTGTKGHIINISSSSCARPATSPYKISKWAIRGMTLGMAEALLPFGIKVCSIAPGKTATPMMGISPEGNIACDNQPIGRYILPKEVANLAVFLACGLGDSIIGDTVFASGGNGTIMI